MRKLFIAGVTALALAGCQSADQSYFSAQSTCQEQGLKPGTERYNTCVNATYNANRRQAESDANDAALAAIGGVALGSVLTHNIDRNRRSYYYRPAPPPPPPYYGPRRW